MFDASDEHPMRLAQLAADAERIAAGVSLPPGKRFESLRRMVRQAVAATETGQAIEQEVIALLDG